MKDPALGVTLTKCDAATSSGKSCRRNVPCALHPSAAGLAAAVEDALRHEPEGWRKELARSLARALEDEPNASMAKELRALMADISDHAPQEKTVADELRAKRAARQSGTAAQ